MKIEDLIFPVTVEMFVARQDTGDSGELTEAEQEVAESCVYLINGAYQDGLGGDSDRLDQMLDRVDCGVRQEADPDTRRFYRSLCGLITYAYARGRRDAGKEVRA